METTKPSSRYIHATTHNYPTIELTGQQIKDLQWDFLTPVQAEDVFQVTIHDKRKKFSHLYFAKKVENSYVEQKFNISEEQTQLICAHIRQFGE